MPSLTTATRLLFPPSWNPDPHDRPRGAPPGDLLEAGFPERGSQPRPGEGRRVGSLLRLDRVPLDDAAAPPSNLIDRGAQERGSDAGAPVVPVDEQAGDRPDRLVVDGLQDAGIPQDRITLPWRDGAPGDGLGAVVGQNTRDLARHDNFPESAPVAGPLAAHELGPPPPPVHAPATGARPARSEQADEAGPAPGS